MRNLEFHPLTPALWPELEKLFGERGACGGCWCMWWRLTRSEWERSKGRPNKAAFRKLVDSGTPLGVLVFLHGEPIGWCAVGPRETLPSLDRSRVLAPVDDQPAWSVTCFFVVQHYRKRGVAARLLKAAVEYARAQGARVVEGYPTETRSPSVPDVFAFMGPVSLFGKAGFREVARRSKNRPFMRKIVRPARPRNSGKPARWSSRQPSEHRTRDDRSQFLDSWKTMSAEPAISRVEASDSWERTERVVTSWHCAAASPWAVSSVTHPQGQPDDREPS